MSTLELYTKGARVWIPHPENVWETAELKENYSSTKKTLDVITLNNETKTLNVKDEEALPHLRNPALLIGGNDLTSLSYLHEPAVLYNLQVRFCEQRNIYTYCGIILVAINPYDDLPIYDIDTVQAYRGHAMGDLDPHIFAVAEEAYTKLEREQRDQSIIVSGESGAGKTVSAKYIMRYFATVGGNAIETQVEKKVLASSPIMEAMGNAKTTRNDNSSRFGKFIELQFNNQLLICGASMRTYLLEKSRVVFQSRGERNYHIFYQLCAARNELPDLRLDHQDKFNYLNQGDSSIIEGVDDYETFQEMVGALKILGFSEEEKIGMFKILAALLHLGNLKFEEAIVKMGDEDDMEGCAIAEDHHFKALADLLEIDAEELRQWLCIRKIVSVREVFLKPMSVESAKAARDALAKHIYAELFNWIVLILNCGLESNMPRHKFIGVLDIYGFETFELNSFEQFCINYANEKLQQQFNLHVFKLEQEEYVKEGIEWKMIDFYDNQPCIDLIEVKLGILDLLDEECRMPRGTDSSWTEKLYTKCAKYSHFGKGKFGRSAFTISHFAGKVEYESNGFLEKNRDTVIEEQINVIKQSKSKLVSRLFCSDAQKQANPGTKVKIIPSKPKPGAQKSHKKSVGCQFKDSLSRLMDTLNSTTPYYIRCIKPNDNKHSFEFNPKRAAQQLRACGVLETIRLSAAGFPSRWTYNEFFCRYRVLCKFKDVDKNNMEKTCENIIRQYIKKSDMYQFGKTKIFFRASQVAYLETLRSEKLKRCCIIMQKTVRAFIAKKKYLRIKRSVMLLQRYGRGYLARRLATRIRRERAAIMIQKHVRGWIRRIQYQRLRKSAIGIQTYCRGYLARLKYLKLKYNAKATIIQKHWRGWLGRKRADRIRNHIVICQAAIRRYLAKKQYKKLKIEARSIEHVKALNKGLENKIISLQQKIDELHKQNNALEKNNNNFTKEIKDLKNKMTSFKALEIEVKNLNNLVIDKNKIIDELKNKITTETDEKMDLVLEREKLIEEKKQEAEERLKLVKEIESLKELAKTTEKNSELQLENRLEEEKNLMMDERDSDRQAYQRLLQDYHELEQRYEELERQQENRTVSHQRNISDVSSITTLDIPEDHGYGSVRSASSASTNRERVDNIDWKIEASSESRTPSSNEETRIDVEQKLDLGLVLRLQRKLAEVERDKLRMEQRLEELDNSPKVADAMNAARDSLRISELEMQNSTLKTQLLELQNSINEGTAKAQLLEQLKLAQNELERKAEEIIQLKCVLASQTNNMKSIVNSKSRIDTGLIHDEEGEYINEDGELALAYETQKTINKQLELELQDEKAKYKAYEKEYKLEIARLREENEEQQKILSANLVNNQQTQNEIYLQHEITRLTKENLDLLNQKDAISESNKKMKRQHKYLTKRFKDAGIEINDTQIDIESTEKKDAVVSKPIRKVYAFKRQEREYLGMFSYPAGEEANIMKNLVIQLKPRTAITLLPCLPAYIVFMCIRHTDFINDEEKVKSFLSCFTNAVKKVVKKRYEDFETTVLWLANTLRLLHNMKQYSGEKAFQHKNTPKQNEKCLRNFDLSEYRQLLSDIAVWICQGSIKSLKKTVKGLIVGAVLEHEEIQGISGNIPGAMRGRIGSVTTPGSPTQKPITQLLQELTNHHKILTFYGVDTEVISQIFRQIFYFLCATSLNNLLLRKDLCHWSKGIQIRHNLSHFEMWIRDKNLDETCVHALKPIIQAAQLLQARKEEEKDVLSICDMCSDLTGHMICKILNLYTPVDEYEKRISKNFIQNVQAELKRRHKPEEPRLMEVNFLYPLKFPFNPSDICFERIEVPEVLDLGILEKV
ncbi:unconventional myosin-Va isoform X3 [Coccinella septempunctata]|uniref:unconventional myosin-Va isoform X3 n=1 Tax=Coccinella septempunctata TaxID=41139 RepID=UPI001D08A1FB|nr:unconventional myosin-Va isoform X3 [Coccinella septempunctata]